MVDPAVIDSTVVFAALSGAIAWDLVTWWFRIPSSSSHARIGGLAGAAVATSGTAVLDIAGRAKVGASFAPSAIGARNPPSLAAGWGAVLAAGGCSPARR